MQAVSSHVGARTRTFETYGKREKDKQMQYTPEEMIDLLFFTDEGYLPQADLSKHMNTIIFAGDKIFKIDTKLKKGFTDYFWQEVQEPQKSEIKENINKWINLVA